RHKPKSVKREMLAAPRLKNCVIPACDPVRQRRIVSGSGGPPAADSAFSLGKDAAETIDVKHKA
ncbi:MAG TPA: hypothetical protein VKS81_09460, partial [Bacteroidota bacterium]|nr:hypothetical protein [Bacteroidota bacterium]